MPTTTDVLAAINREHGRAWQLIERLESGWQSGASLIEDHDGRAVLKWSDKTWWADRVLGASSLVEHTRAAGYPTPAWLAVGVTDAGLPYHVQELVDGAPVAAIDDDCVRMIQSLTQLQREIRLPIGVDWTEFICREVFTDFEDQQARLLDAGEQTAAAVRGSLELAAPHRDAELVHDEMVHGDLSVDNILVRAGAVAGVIDIEAIGRGCATFDLLAPSRQDFVWGHGEYGGALIEEALRRDGAAFTSIAVAAHVVNILAFGLDHWPTGDVQGAAVDLLGWIDATRSAIAR